MWRSRLAFIGAPLVAAVALTPPIADVRPPVDLEVRLAGPDYLSLMPDTQAIRVTMQDTLRAILGFEFGFVNWSETPAQPETLVVRIFKPDTGMVHACLRLDLRGTVSATDTAACPLEFETWSKTITRMDWRASSVRHEWGHVFDSLLTAQRDRLVKARFGKLAINAPVTLDRDNLLASVGINPAVIRAAADSQDMEFRLTTVWHDTGAAIATRDPNAELWLGNCIPPEIGDGLVCEIKTFFYKGQPLQAAANRGLLLRARFDAFGVHLNHYRPALFPVNDDGLVDVGGHP